jgi:UDP-galactopyranose mutase
MYLIVGCGLSGAVIAQQITEKIKEKVIIIEKRDHIGGNCYDYIDEDTNILLNKYGPHFFHTNNKEVWEYINRFSKWIRYEHVVLSHVDNTFVPVPANITTVNKLCNENIQNEEEMNKWLNNNQVKFDKIENGEQMAKSRVGEVLYEKLFKNYTYKQWNMYPNELKPEVLARIPVRNNQDTRYFSDKFQALPEKGYTKFFENILNNPLIEVRLNTDFFEFKKQNNLDNFKSIIYTGPIDHYFSSLGFEKLQYRSLNFVFEKHFNMNYYQPTGQVNYPNLDKEFTRITEYKHCLNQTSKHTIISKEYSCDEGEPYYPVLNDKNLELYEKYKKMADRLKEKNIHFIGRLANYKYFNMDQAIKNALDYFNNNFNIKRYCLILTGHIRNSFNDKNLYKLIKKIRDESNNNLDIYFQTWNVFEAKKSWRPLEKNYKSVSVNTIYSYFNDLSYLIKKIIILDDRKIIHNGNNNGMMSNSKLPIICYKNWWYGKNEITKIIPNINYFKVITTRPDLLLVKENNYGYTYTQNRIIKDIFKNSFSHKIISFIDNYDKEFISCCCYFRSDLDTIKKFTSYFYHNMNKISNKYKFLHQEYCVYYEAVNFKKIIKNNKK